MMWFKTDVDVAQHDKIYALAATLKIRRSAAAGGLSFLWGWAFRFAQDGNIAKYPVLEIMKIMDLPRKPQRIYAALLEVQLLEERDDGVYIRNWEEEDRVGDCLKNLEKTKLRYKRKNNEESDEKNDKKSSNSEEICEEKSLNPDGNNETFGEIQANFSPKTPHIDLDKDLDLDIDLDKEKISQSYQSNQSISQADKANSQKPTDRIEPTDEFNKYTGIIRKNVEYDPKRYLNPNKQALFDDTVAIIVDVVCSKALNIRVNKTDTPQQLVKKHFLKLRFEHIEYALERLDQSRTKKNNIRNYMITTLYNAVDTVNLYREDEINQDFPIGEACS